MDEIVVVRPSRFRCGEVTLQVDEAWRERMSGVTVL
jgi:hypothetical protein